MCASFTCGASVNSRASINSDASVDSGVSVNNCTSVSSNTTSNFVRASTVSGAAFIDDNSISGISGANIDIGRYL